MIQTITQNDDEYDTSKVSISNVNRQTPDTPNNIDMSTDRQQCLSCQWQKTDKGMYVHKEKYLSVCQHKKDSTSTSTDIMSILTDRFGHFWGATF